MDTKELVRSAALAPSSHNTQPWIFQTQPHAINLFADRSRALPANDPHDRELTISCGCALFNLRAAAAAHGHSASVTTLPDPQDLDLLAQLVFANADEPEGLSRLAGEIPRRRTYRKRFEDREVARDILYELSRAAETESSELHVIDDEPGRHAVVDLVAEGDSIQWSDPSWRRELAQWMHSGSKGDGLTVPGLVAPIAQAVVRTFDMGNGVAAKDRQLADASPVIAILATVGDSPADWLAAGQALERTLLTASHHGLQASYLNQPIQVSSLRSKLRDLIPGKPFPQIILRIGYPMEEIDAAPRRKLNEVLKEF